RYSGFRRSEADHRALVQPGRGRVARSARPVQRGTRPASGTWSSAGAIGATVESEDAGHAPTAGRGRDRARGPDLGGISAGSAGDFYLTLVARVRKRFARAIVVSTLEGRSSFTEAFRLLAFKKMATFHELGRELGVGF